jgi:hypothetical protein
MTFAISDLLLALRSEGWQPECVIAPDTQEAQLHIPVKNVGQVIVSLQDPPRRCGERGLSALSLLFVYACSCPSDRATELLPLLNLLNKASPFPGYLWDPVDGTLALRHSALVADEGDLEAVLHLFNHLMKQWQDCANILRAVLLEELSIESLLAESRAILEEERSKVC